MTGFRPVSLLLGGLTLFGLAGSAQAEREVVVNGLRQSAGEIAELERLNCGPIPDGNYWLGRRSGIWGYEGNAKPMGRISERCVRRRPTLERLAKDPVMSPNDAVYKQLNPDSIHREESEIGTTSQPHAPTQQEDEPR